MISAHVQPWQAEDQGKWSFMCLQVAYHIGPSCQSMPSAEQKEIIAGDHVLMSGRSTSESASCECPNAFSEQEVHVSIGNDFIGSVSRC